MKCDNLCSSPIDRSYWCLVKCIFNNFCHSTFSSLFHTDDIVTISLNYDPLFLVFFSLTPAWMTTTFPHSRTYPLLTLCLSPMTSFGALRKAPLSLYTSGWHSSSHFEGMCIRTCGRGSPSVLLLPKTTIHPSSWKYTLVQPKKVDRLNRSNYRPVALTSFFFRVLESLISMSMHFKAITNLPHLQI